MKTLTIAATLILAGVIAYSVAAYAQPAAAGKADPVKVDAKHYKVEFENESVRVLRISYAPGGEVGDALPSRLSGSLPYRRQDSYDHARREIGRHSGQGWGSHLDARREPPPAECG